jgi:hypothetical protein
MGTAVRTIARWETVRPPRSPDILAKLETLARSQGLPALAAVFSETLIGAFGEEQRELIEAGRHKIARAINDLGVLRRLLKTYGGGSECADGARAAEVIDLAINKIEGILETLDAMPLLKVVDETEDDLRPEESGK